MEKQLAFEIMYGSGMPQSMPPQGYSSQQMGGYGGRGPMNPGYGGGGGGYGAMGGMGGGGGYGRGGFNPMGGMGGMGGYGGPMGYGRGGGMGLGMGFRGGMHAPRRRKQFVGGTLESQREWERQNLCCFYLQGQCKFADRCRYSHEDDGNKGCQFGLSCRVGHASRSGSQKASELAQAANGGVAPVPPVAQ